MKVLSNNIQMLTGLLVLFTFRQMERKPYLTIVLQMYDCETILRLRRLASLVLYSK